MRRTKAQISYNMSRIHGAETGIEVSLRKELSRRGLRYRKNSKTLIGKPDIVFARYKVVVFCDGEFWHGFDWKHRKADLKRHKAFWIAKIERNMARDKLVTATLRKEGWTVLRFWGKDIKRDVRKIGDKIEQTLVGVLLAQWRAEMDWEQ